MVSGWYLKQFTSDLNETLEYCDMLRKEEPYWFSEEFRQGQGHSRKVLKKFGKNMVPRWYL